MLTQTEAKGIDIMGTTDQQGTSKRVRIVLCMLVVLGVTAAAPASGLAADWTSIHVEAVRGLDELEPRHDRRPAGAAAIARFVE